MEEKTQELGFPSSWKAPEPQLADDRPQWRPVRHVVKETLTVALGSHLEPVQVNVDGLMAAHVGRMAEVVVTSVDGGETAVVQGVTVSTDHGGRYFRLAGPTHEAGTKTKGLPDDAPSWVRDLIDAVERDQVSAPVQRCGLCGYAAEPDGRGGWRHTSAITHDVSHRLRLVGGVS